MKQKLRKLIPYTLKLQLKLLQRRLDERKTGFSYATGFNENLVGDCKTELNQVIKEGAFHENKIHNLQRVAHKINHLVMHPDEVFSFWKAVGKPDQKNNFKQGRNLIQNKIATDFGGGICQFSSIIYYLALQSGLKIIERHPHSVDIYKENERFTPLGSDSTVVFGYKDLQIKNNFPFPVQFKCSIEENQLYFTIISQQAIKLNTINFKYYEVKNGIWVETLFNGQTLFKNFYIRL